MANIKKGIIIQFQSPAEQIVGATRRIVGLTPAKYLVPIIDGLNLEANPRSSKTGPVTDAIQESIENDPLLFPLKTKGLLLAASQYKRLDRNRYEILPVNPEIEGILDGGHNTLAIGLYILQSAMGYQGTPMPRGSKTWNDFKKLWDSQHSAIKTYLKAALDDPTVGNLNFLVPIELLVPHDDQDPVCVESFKNELLEICAARNNNVQLQVAAKANQHGYFEELKQFLGAKAPAISCQVEWKTNEGGSIKAQDIIALMWIPLSLITPVKDSNGREIEPVAPEKLYAGKGACLKQFERLMSSPEVTIESGIDYKKQLNNSEVLSAFQIGAELPDLYDYIYQMFPKAYNAAGGSYGRIREVKSLNDRTREKISPFTRNPIETMTPTGYITPLVYGLQALMGKRTVGNHYEIYWMQSPMDFLKKNLNPIVESYMGIFNMCNYDPQKIGKNPQSYKLALQAYKMAIAGIL